MCDTCNARDQMRIKFAHSHGPWDCGFDRNWLHLGTSCSLRSSLNVASRIVRKIVQLLLLSDLLCLPAFAPRHQLSRVLVATGCNIAFQRLKDQSSSNSERMKRDRCLFGWPEAMPLMYCFQGIGICGCLFMRMKAASVSSQAGTLIHADVVAAADWLWMCFVQVLFGAGAMVLHTAQPRKIPLSAQGSILDTLGCHRFIENRLRVSELFHTNLALGSLHNENTRIDIVVIMYWVTSHRRVVEISKPYLLCHPETPTYEQNYMAGSPPGPGTNRNELQRTATSRFENSFAMRNERQAQNFLETLWPVWCCGRSQAFCLPSEFPHLRHVLTVVWVKPKFQSNRSSTRRRF